MYAVIFTGGKQYRVSQGNVLRIEKLPSEVGQEIEFDKILMVANGEAVSVGKPYVENAKVTAEVLQQSRGKKIRIIKVKRRKHHRKTQGHRQYFTEIKITGIDAAAVVNGATATESDHNAASA